MKDFFFQISMENKQQQDGLLDVLLKTDYQNNRAKLYRVLYDAADILHDKRLEAKDEELKRFFEESVNNMGVKGTDAGADTKSVS